MTHPESNGTERGTQRIEAFSDGVFAIAITLLVLELRIPAAGGSDSGSLLDAILSLWPSYFAYGLSFTMIASTGPTITTCSSSSPGPITA